MLGNENQRWPIIFWGHPTLYVTFNANFDILFVLILDISLRQSKLIPHAHKKEKKFQEIKKKFFFVFFTNMWTVFDAKNMSKTQFFLLYKNYVTHFLG